MAAGPSLTVHSACAGAGKTNISKLNDNPLNATAFNPRMVLFPFQTVRQMAVADS